MHSGPRRTLGFPRRFGVPSALSHPLWNGETILYQAQLYESDQRVIPAGPVIFDNWFFSGKTIPLRSRSSPKVVSELDVFTVSQTNVS